MRIRRKLIKRRVPKWSRLNPYIRWSYHGIDPLGAAHWVFNDNYLFATNQYTRLDGRNKREVELEDNPQDEVPLFDD